MSEAIVTGLAELQKFLDQMPAKMEANVLRGALRQGAKVQLERARELVPVETGGKHPGALRDSLRISTRMRRGVVKSIVRAGNKRAFYANWVEYGTAAHEIKPKTRKSLFFAGLFGEIVEHPGAKPRPFLRPALDATQNAVIAAVGAYIRRRLDKAGLLDVPGPENT